ncbi:MAG: XRE family transcriptional regulator [Spirochaetia bacterium]|jgi:transcriptional regulator with XRE-family HTH domain|nr:XRE family transcriptional regulator [Spirochaetia bacterium]
MKFYSIDKLDAKMKPEVLDKARKIYEQESLNIKLKYLREKHGVKQKEMTKFTQTAISKLEKRKDIRISTLIEYLDSMDMGLEIIAFSKDKKNKKELLLRV